MLSLFNINNAIVMCVLQFVKLILHFCDKKKGVLKNKDTFFIANSHIPGIDLNIRYVADTIAEFFVHFQLPTCTSPFGT